MNKERIELSAKGKLEDILSRLGYVTPEIPSNDKTPSWDGFIRLYKNEESSAKSNLDRMIPVQLKGHYQKPPYNESANFDIDVIDLKNYLNHSGVFFFVVYLDENGAYKIYYDALTPLKIRRLLKGRESQKTISVYLQSFPENNKKSAVDIFFAFTLDMEMSLPPTRDITLEDAFNNKIPGFDTFNISYRGIQYKEDPFGYFLSQPSTLSLKNSYTGISFPIEIIVLESISSNCNESISISGIQYYNNFEIVRQKENTFILRLGKSFTYNFQVNENTIKGTFNYTIQGNLPERINDIKFLLAYLENKEFEIGTYKAFPLTDEQVNSIDIKYFQNKLHLLEKIDELLKKLKISTVLDYDKITEKEEKTFIDLINTVLLGAPCIPDNPEALYKLQLANLNILLVANKIDEEKYKIINYFSDENKRKFAFSYNETTNNKNMFLIPSTFILREEDFISLDNIDYDMIYNDIINSQDSEELKKYTYYFMQEMIAGAKKRTKSKNGLFCCIDKALNYLNRKVSDFNYAFLDNDFEKILG